MAEGFDPYLGKRWIYPNNMTIRAYQKTAVEKALFNNAMIVLPTGFGKTFIAAVVMYNFYRWYPTGKLIFVAPTKPLVAQQIIECRKISGIPSSDCVELTGLTHQDKRINLWKTKRVFFATPQVIENDLENDIIPAHLVRCLVIDEAHRAQGSYAYVGIVRNLHEKNRNGFRILAMSATPGSDIQRVQQVMINLYISEVMFRTENSLDLLSFKNQKVSKAWTVVLTGPHKRLVDTFIEITKPVYKEIYRAGLTFSKDSIELVAPYLLIMAKKRLDQNEVPINGSSKGKLSYILMVATTLSFNFNLLVVYGIRPFYSSVMRNLSEPKSNIRSCLGKNPEFNKMLSDIRLMFGEDVEPDVNKIPNTDLLKSHPKLTVVKDLLLNHFNNVEEKAGTRAMVFTKFRESVYDIAQALNVYVPTLKVGVFTGQGSSANNRTGMNQKEQLQLVKDFREGKYNVLVATCVAEEGLDIGEIDLIICYDTSSSPISNTQRRGRTGRKRAGDIQTLLTKDYEETKLRKAANSRRQVEEQLYNRENYMAFRYRDAPRMVPPDINPVCLEQKIYPVNDDKEEVEKPKKKRKTSTPRVTVTSSLKKGKKAKKIDESENKEDLDKSQEELESQKEKELCKLVMEDTDDDWDNDNWSDDVDWGNDERQKEIDREIQEQLNKIRRDSIVEEISCSPPASTT